MRRMTQRELVDELAGLAEVARKSGPIGLEKVEIDDPFMAKGIRFVTDGYDTSFIRDNLERDRANAVREILAGEGLPSGNIYYGGRQVRHRSAVS